MTRALEPQMRSWVLGARVFTTLSVLAVLVAMIGVYAMTAFEVRQRTREIGIRIALGARGENVVAHFVRGEGRIPGAGVLLGMAVAFGAGRFVESMLFGVGARDPLAMAEAGALVLIVAIVASYVPSSWAAHIDPMIALRDE